MFWNHEHLLYHNSCKVTSTQQQLTNIGPGVCRCQGDTSTDNIIVTPQFCSSLTSTSCSNQPTNIFCAEVDRFKYRTFNNDCDAKRYACKLTGIKVRKIRNSSGPCNCSAQPYESPTTIPPSSSTTTDRPSTIPTKPSIDGEVCAHKDGNFASFDSLQALNEFNFNNGLSWCSLRVKI